MEVTIKVLLWTIAISCTGSNVLSPVRDHLKCAFGRLRGSTTECNPEFAEATCPSGFLCSGGPQGEGGPCCVRTNPCNQGRPLDVDGEAVTCSVDKSCPAGYSCLTGRNSSFSVCCPGIYPGSMYFISTHPDMLNSAIEIERRILSFVETSSLPRDKKRKKGNIHPSDLHTRFELVQEKDRNGDNLIQPRLPGEAFLRRNPLLPNLKIYEQPVIVSSVQAEGLEMCKYVACLAVHIREGCRQESIMEENGKKCIGCPVNICESPDVCPSLAHCKDISHLPGECQQPTVIEFNGLLCPGCKKDSCGKPKCVERECPPLAPSVPRQCIRRLQTTEAGDKICGNCFENTCITTKEASLDYCTQAQCEPLPAFVPQKCIRFPVISVGGKNCLGCPEYYCEKMSSI